MSVQFPFTKSVCGNLRKNGKQTAVRQNSKEKRSKKIIIKKYFSENYAYFLPILTLGERKKGVVLMGY